VLLALLLLGTGLGIGLGLSQAPPGPAHRATPRSSATHSLRPAPSWLLTAVSRELADFPTGARVATSSPDGRPGEEAHYAETTFLRASQAMGRPSVLIDPFLGGLDRSPVWFVVVTGTRTYEDIAAYLFRAGQVTPSGNTVEFAFAAHGGDLLMNTAASGGSSPRAVLSFPGIRFLPTPAPLPAASPQGGLTALLRQDHVGVGSCPSTTTEMTVTANTLTITQQQWVVLTAVMRNLSHTSCRFIGFSAPGGALSKQRMGPCGMTPMEVLNPAGALVWPGGVYNCPELQAVVLRPDRSVEAQGDWYGGQAPPGDYTVVVAQRFAFKLTVL
jgi:hypothetical protein